MGFLRTMVILGAMIAFVLTVSAAEMDSYDDGWIKVSTILSGVYRFEENGACSYLVIGENEAVLIDAGYGVSNLRKLCAELTSLPVSVVNTHGHVDHVGSDQFFDKVFIHEKDASQITKGLWFGSRIWAQNELKKNPLLPAGFDLKKWTYPPVKPYKMLEDGEILNFGDVRLEVIWTPGHTSGSISLLEREKKLLFTGDTFVPGEMWIQLNESDYPKWVNSAEKLASLKSEVTKVLPGHGYPCDTDMLEALGEAVTEIRNGSAEESSVKGPFGRCKRTAFPLFSVLHK